ncbi:prolipoprotein diacylglyceryl transferase [Arthrobacter sp. Hiyo4]|nr:prolipoprotein diacylglyceryl transferase [Arthrobacter sp. Hiyo4]
MGTLRIHAYALCILAGIIVGLWLTSVRWTRRGAPEGSVWDIVIWAIPFGIIGGRLYHVVSSRTPTSGPASTGPGTCGSSRRSSVADWASGVPWFWASWAPGSAAAGPV